MRHAGEFWKHVLIVSLFVSWSPAGADVCEGISTASDSPLTTVRVVSGLSRPVLAISPPADVDRLFLVEQDGTIRIRKAGEVLAEPFLDIAAIVRSPLDGGNNEEGLLGLAFHPDYANNGWFFVYHTNTSGNNEVARYAVSANPDVADASSREPVITFNHPGQGNHNGGMIAFGPNDGFLYIGTGDGGGFCDLSENAQNGSSPLGKLHRIDVGDLPYAVPDTNPFVGNPAFLDEIWSYGLRNPWRWSFDRANGDLYIGDVGQGQWEEVNWRPASSTGMENYGWDNYEGNACPNPSCGNEGTCSLPSYVAPVSVYAHESGLERCSVTGGFVYRGCRMPALAGTYFYGDYCEAFIKSFRVVPGNPPTVTDEMDRTDELTPGGPSTIGLITSFGEDARGELYVVDRDGDIFKIVPVLSNLEVSGSGAVPFLLSRDGDWTWEDLQSTSDHPLVGYKVYRSTGPGNGTFDCVHQRSDTTWPGGDPTEPSAAELFTYLVTALNAAGTESSPGEGTSTPRTLSTVACP
jgi:glucose/arabinose dehydrogenase